MGIMDIFSFKSKEQQIREQEQYQQRIFPLGLDQRSAALQTLRELSPKTSDETLLYAFVTAKDHYLQNNCTPNSLMEWRSQFIKRKWVSDPIAARIAALVRLDTGVTSLDDYPTAQKVLSVEAD